MLMKINALVLNPRMPMVKDMEAILRLIYDYESKFADKALKK